ncbi:MAG: hypothetical protein U0W65_01770 [Bacteroidia bacterium]
MKTQLLSKHQKALLLNVEEFPKEIMQLVHRKKWLLIWVSKEFNGLDASFSKGLKLLYHLAKTDGSLGWFVTLCSGANYFSKNLKPNIAKEIFSTKHVCLGGSGMVTGTAKAIDKNNFILNGTWKYATGAPHLTHFTLNANVDNEIVSFVVPKDKVTIIPDWQSMGMRATNTFSFQLKDVVVSKKYSFRYNKFYIQDNSSGIPFTVFADLTLLVNYIGMAHHFAECVSDKQMQEFCESILKQTMTIAKEIENTITNKKALSTERMLQIHSFGEDAVTDLCNYFIGAYTKAGVEASKTSSPINQIFRDFFTATQHANFRKKETLNTFA